MSRVTSKTRICGILGHPVGHSLSPAIHNAAFAALGLDYVYVAHDVLPDRLGSAIEGVRALGYRGLSVTIPHKVAALSAVDEVDPTAEGIGCINTIVNDGTRLRGYNSDGRGALHALRQSGVEPAGQRVVVLGSGGAARAVAMTLAMEAPPAELLVLGVIPEELEGLVEDLASRGRAPVQGEVYSVATLGEKLRSADILLQCTPVGMYPKTEASLVPAELLHSKLAVFDAVYNPRRTRLIEDASAAGCRVIEGMEMFLGQAVVQFELWTGQEAPVTVMRRVVEECL